MKMCMMGVWQESVGHFHLIVCGGVFVCSLTQECRHRINVRLDFLCMCRHFCTISHKDAGGMHI